MFTGKLSPPFLRAPVIRTRRQLLEQAPAVRAEHIARIVVEPLENAFRAYYQALDLTTRSRFRIFWQNRHRISSY